MSAEDLRVVLERLAGPPAGAPDTASIRRRAARRRRHRRLAQTAGLVVVAVMTGLLQIATSRGGVREAPTATERLPAVGSSTAPDTWAVDAEQQLFDAARRDDAGTIAILVQSGVDPDATARDGITALIVAALRNDTASLEVLLESGATVDAANDFDATALQVAAQQGNVEVVELLLDADADPNRPPTENWGVTALMEAARFGRAEVVEVLLQHGADPNVVDPLGRPTVLYALDAPDPGAVIRTFRDADVVLAHPTVLAERAIRFADHTVDELVDILCELDVRGPTAGLGAEL